MSGALLEGIRRKCYNIRKSKYPAEGRPAARYKSQVLRLAASTKIIVDVGCGPKGEWLQSIVDNFKFGYGVDLDVAECSSTRFKLLRGDAECLPLPDQAADVITAYDAVEHFKRPAAFFRECARVLRPGGQVVLLTPSKWHPPVMLGRLLPQYVRRKLNRVATGTLEHETYPAYYRANSLGTVQALACQAGLSVVTAEYISDHPRYFMFSTLAYRAACFLERAVLRRQIFAPLRQGILVVLQRPEAG